MRAISKRLIITTYLLVAAGFVSQAPAQTRPITAEEYLRSVSVQAKDRSVQGPAEAGVQRVDDIAALPPRRQSTSTETAGFTPKNPNSIPYSQSRLPDVHTAQFQTGAPAASSSTSRYPYPAQSPPRVAPSTLPDNSGFGGSRTFVNSASTINGTSAAIGNLSFGTNAMSGTNAMTGTNATFGTNSTNVIAPPNSAAANYAVPRSALTGYPNSITAPTSYPPASYPPTIYPPANYSPTNVSSPNGSAFRQDVYRAPTLGLGPAGTANPGFASQTQPPVGQTIGTNFLSPTQIAPQPIYPLAAPLSAPGQLQNMPPGNYQGTGLDGRPVTYVDGQPVRNLFRYIFP